MHQKDAMGLLQYRTTGGLARTGTAFLFTVFWIID